MGCCCSWESWTRAGSSLCASLPAGSCWCSPRAWSCCLHPWPNLECAGTAELLAGRCSGTAQPPAGRTVLSSGGWWPSQSVPREHPQLLPEVGGEEGQVLGAGRASPFLMCSPHAHAAPSCPIFGFYLPLVRSRHPALAPPAGSDPQPLAPSFISWRRSRGKMFFPPRFSPPA